MSTYNRDADERYKQKSTQRYSFRLNKNTEPELIAYLDTVSNKQGLIKTLIRQEMNRAQAKK